MRSRIVDPGGELTADQNDRATHCDRIGRSHLAHGLIAGASSDLPTDYHRHVAAHDRAPHVRHCPGHRRANVHIRDARG